MKVSIVMPIKNAAQWLADTIDSIQNQTYSNWELICIDDASTDNSFLLVQSYSEKDNRIKIYRNESSGIIPALQQGLRISIGEYVTRMDADDIMPNERLEQMVDYISVLPPKTIVTGKVQYFSENKEVSEGYLKYEKWLNDLTNHYKHIYRECIIASPNWLVRRTDLITENIFEELTYPEDYCMCFLWYSKNFKIASLNVPTLLWREHPERTSRNSDVYDQESFFRLKLNWFCKLNRDPKISILGAGPKGKLAVKELLNQGKEIQWFDLKFENFGAPIFDIEIKDYEKINGNKLLIAIYPENLSALNSFLKSKGYKIGENAWYL